MWVLFEKAAGLPEVCRNGLHAPPPAAPPPPETSHVKTPRTAPRTKCEVQPSFASANAQSLHREDEGHGGKLQFLRS